MQAEKHNTRKYHTEQKEGNRMHSDDYSTYTNSRQASSSVEYNHRQRQQHIRGSRDLDHNTRKNAHNQRDRKKFIQDNRSREPRRFINEINNHINNNNNLPLEQTPQHQSTVPQWEWRNHILPPDDPRSSMFTRDTQPRVIPSAPPSETPRINIEPNSMDHMKTATYTTTESCQQHSQTHCLNQECINQKNLHSHPQRMYF
jgi:hypothetical protein